MSEYNLGFSEKLIDAAVAVVDDGLEEIDAKRTVLYLSLLSCEITLKALLEKAEIPVNKIKKHSHKVGRLLDELGSCEIEIEIEIGNGNGNGNNTTKWVSGSRLRALVTDEKYNDATVGTILEAESAGASSYPNKIRYGESPAHYSPELTLKTAIKAVSWAKKYWESIRVAKI